MQEAKCGVLPIVDAEGKLTGIVTDRDLCLATAVRRRSATQVAVNEAMTRRVATCGPGDDLRTALHVMGAAGVRRLPVVDPEGHLRGLLSIDDVVMWGVQEGGVTDADVVDTLRRACQKNAAAWSLQEADLL
jgi:CBS domain-containing protein